jgi:type VI secretion system protein ImpD/type VI secretion system protein ImpC
MNDTDLADSASATLLADVVASEPAPETPPEQAGIRDAVLAGRFVGARDQALQDRLAEFLAAEPAQAAELWFGASAASRLRAQADGLRCAFDRDIAAIDTAVSEQVDAILHDKRLQKLEGSWRGLAWLVDGADQGTRLKIKLLNIGWAEICRDLERAIEFDQSHLFRKIYEEEFGTPGGEPYGLLIVDHEVRHRPGPGSRTDDVTALASLSSVAAAAFAPVILGASPALLEVDSFTDLAVVTEVTAALRNADHARWRSLAARADMRFVGLALPRLLARLPWQDDGTRADSVRYAEHVPTPEERVWMNAAYAFASVVARAFANYAWPADVRGVETDRVGGGLVEAMPVEPFHTDPDHVWTRPAVEIVWNDHQERELLEAGLMPLSSIVFSEELVFGAVRSVQAAQRYQGANAAAAEANARLSSQINSILCASRFAHHLKMKGRQMVGSYKTADEIERALQDWLTQYVNANTSSAGETRARYPLVNGRVTVNEVPGKPGSFGCIVHLQPHYQLDDVAATFQLVTDLGGRR